MVVIGATVAAAAMQEGLVDELVVHLAPILLGDGVRLFESRSGARIKLERTGRQEVRPGDRPVVPRARKDD